MAKKTTTQEVDPMVAAAIGDTATPKAEEKVKKQGFGPHQKLRKMRVMIDELLASEDPAFWSDPANRNLVVGFRNALVRVYAFDARYMEPIESKVVRKDPNGEPITDANGKVVTEEVLLSHVAINPKLRTHESLWPNEARPEAPPVLDDEARAALADILGDM